MSFGNYTYSTAGNGVPYGSIVYFPEAFVMDAKIHQGKTKTELLEDKGHSFQLLLIESDPNIPAGNTNEIVGTKQPRKRLEAGDTPKNYLETLQTKPEYRGEEGLTPEASMTHFLLHLEETNQIIDDFDGNGKVNFNLGGWMPDMGDVAYGLWSRHGTQARWSGSARFSQDSKRGARSAVRI
jgi:hypothetical protein